MKSYSFKNRITGSILVFKDTNGPDAALQLIKQVGDYHINWEIID
jgi:hypothetical protein